MNKEENVIEDVMITTDVVVHITIKNKTVDKSYYLPVIELIRILREDFERVSALPENSIDKERNTRLLSLED